MLNEHFEKLIKVELGNKTMLNKKGTELTSKLSTYMISPPWKLPFLSSLIQFLTQQAKKGFWQPRGTLKDGNRCMK
jgi:hypothetical protein